MDFKDEWFKLVLEELRKNSDKIDRVRDDMYTKVDDLDEKMSNRMSETTKQHLELLSCQQSLNKEHHRMNDLLEEHIRRTEILEDVTDVLRERLDRVDTATAPIVKEFNENLIVEKNHKRNISKTVKIAGGISAVAAAVSGILKLLGYL